MLDLCLENTRMMIKQSEDKIIKINPFIEIDSLLSSKKKQLDGIKEKVNYLQPMQIETQYQEKEKQSFSPLKENINTSEMVNLKSNVKNLLGRVTIKDGIQQEKNASTIAEKQKFANISQFYLK